VRQRCAGPSHGTHTDADADTDSNADANTDTDTNSAPRAGSVDFADAEPA
jgi:hypothetical protein